MSDLEFYLSRSFKIICNGPVELPVYDCLLILNSSHMGDMAISYRLAVICTENFRQNFRHPPPAIYFYPRAIFSQNLTISSLRQREATLPK